ncbi:MAG: GGDEF domain-containing protein, partial [Cyanobacteria bacterium P01_F01_bin.4]
RTDGLTGLSNRRDMLDKIYYEALRCERNQKSFCLVLADIDHFKGINDRHGHNVGDTVLIQVAKTLKRTIRSQDTTGIWQEKEQYIHGYPSRYGGEEFLILLPETDLRGGEIVAEKLRGNINSLRINLPDSSEPIRITMSFGVSIYRSEDEIKTCIKQADDMLYLAKKSGRNQVCARR